MKRVTHPIELNTNQKKTTVFFMIILILMAFLLNQSGIVKGVNFSFSDLFCLVILIVIAYKKELYLPIAPSIYFLVVSIITLLTSVFYVPIEFNLDPQPKQIISDFVKLVAIFVYFIIGYNLAKLMLIESIVKWYSMFGILIGGLGVFLTVFQIEVFSEVLFFAGTRYKGFMIDPNYFSVLNISALVYFSRLNNIKTHYKCLAIFITLLSVLASGSKTGVITLFCYLLFRIIGSLFSRKKKLSNIIIGLVGVIFLMLMTPVIDQILPFVENNILHNIPSITRIQELFTDFDEAISESGSGRDATWKVALQIIQLSPLIGIGIGTYTNIGFDLYHLNNVAHNTFLQVSAEWGIPLAFLFFLYTFILLGKASHSKKTQHEMNKILRDIIIILLIGSMAISLNNARVLWLFLGALVSSVNSSQKCGVQITGIKYLLFKERRGIEENDSKIGKLFKRKEGDGE